MISILVLLLCIHCAVSQIPPAPGHICPDGFVSSKKCQVNDTNVTCPKDFQCFEGACCPLPGCPTGGKARILCKSKQECAPGETCGRGGCCSLAKPIVTVPIQPLCPDNRPSIGSCSGPGTCGEGAYCLNADRCCRIPVCPTGQYAVQPCQNNETCPNGFHCYGHGCCPLNVTEPATIQSQIPLPTCPQGELALAFCERDEECAIGLYCFQDGQGRKGCCLDLGL